MHIKKYMALILQLMIWSGFTLAQWLSGKDHIVTKALLFVVFFYLAFLLARMIVKSNRLSIMVTMLSLMTYGLLHIVMRIVFISSS